MKIVQINSFSNGSTGKIMRSISEECQKKGFTCYNFFGRGNIYNHKTDYRIGNKITIYFHVILARFGFNGYGSFISTKKLIKKLKKINPNVIHLHNIHGYYVNLNVLFKYLKNDYHGKIIWTLHDCWAFTGHCPYYSYVKCEKWKKKCYKCKNHKNYPKSYFDMSMNEHKLKKKLFNGLNNLTIVTPSIWLSNEVKKSFLNNYTITVINNGIDINIFKRYSIIELNDIYIKYNIPKDKKIILGVANIWEKRKGLNDFIEMSKILDKEYIIVLVGIDNKQRKNIPNNIITIQRTDNQYDLARIYNISYIYLNLSEEETFGMTTIEANACGTPSFVLNSTAIPECVNTTSGVIIENNKEKISKIIECLPKRFNNKQIIDHALKYDSTKKIEEYIDLYT